MQQRLFLIVLLSFPVLLSAQNFFDQNVIQEVKLTFFQNNWDAKLDSLKNANEEVYLLAKSVEVNGELFDSVGVKYKGNSSYNVNNAKNPLHIELDYIHKNQDYHGVTDIKLSNGFADPTFVREVLSYEILRQYMDAPRANHAKLWMNGTYWGLYTSAESINKDFVKQHFYTDGKNPFFKCNPTGGAGPGSMGGNPDLVYTNADSATYYARYEMQSDFGWRQIVALMDTLKNHPANLEKVLDIDRVLWMLAFNNVLVNLDSYTGAFAQNYYLYWDENNRFLPIVWDLNMSFGGFTNLSNGGGGGGGGGSLSILQMKQLDPLAQSTNASRPLIKQLLANATYKRMYLAHIRTMLQENFATTAYKDRALAMQALINADVQADTKKFYTYTAFQNNLTQSVTGGAFGNTVGITELMDARYQFLMNNSNITAVPPTITNINTIAVSTGQAIRAQVLNATAATLAFRYDTAAIFQKTVLFDDGLHQDNAAGDGLFGATIPFGVAQYYIYAENLSAGMFSPQRAEHEFYVAAAFPPPPNIGDVVINEFLADNADGSTDEADQLEDWVELHNNTANAIDLTGLYLTDDPANAAKWPFPAGTFLPGNGYLVVWLDEDGMQGPLHANFKLKAAGEFLMLSDGGSTVLDSLSFGQQLADISYGRFPNGTGPFTFMPPTFAASNSLQSGTYAPENQIFVDVYPNPYSSFLNIRSSQPLATIQVCNALGQPVLSVAMNGKNATVLDLQTLPAGLYFVQCTAINGAVEGVKRVKSEK